MNRNSILLICILSVLSLSGLVLGDEISIEFEVCSFRPNTPAPTAKPITPKPIETYPPPKTDAPTGSTNPDIATSTPEIATTTPEIEIGTRDEDETGESSAATTPADITTPAAETGSASTPEGEAGSTTTPTVETTPTQTKPTTSEGETPDGDSTPDGGDKTTPTTPTTPSKGSEDEVSGETEETKATKATTPETTRKPEVTTTPTEDSETEETTEIGNEGQELAKRGMDDDEEKLISHKRLLAGSYDEWPKTYDDKMKEYVKEAFDGYVDTKKATNIEVTKTEYNATKKEEGTVKYSIIIKVTYTSTEDRTYWDGIQGEIESNNAEYFYGNITEKTGDDYTKCSNKPGHLKTPTPCIYGKSLYLYTTENNGKQEIKPVANPMPGYTINYTVTCPSNENDGVKYLTPAADGTGQVTVNTEDQKPYVLCSVICKVNNDVNEEYRNGYTSFTVKVTDSKPTYNAIGSSIPKSANSNKNISISLKLTYPPDVTSEGVKVKLNIEKTDNCEANYEEVGAIAGDFIKFENIRFNCTSSDRELIPVTLTFKDESEDDKKIIDFGGTKDATTFNEYIKIVPKFQVVENGKVEDLDNSDNVEYVCKNNLPADVNGLCCSRDANLGESCTKSIITFPFEVASGMEQDDWTKFVKSYLDTIRRYVFGGTNFNFKKIDEESTLGKKQIKIEITFYERKIWLYNYNSGDSELVRRMRELQAEINWKALSSPYDYINTVLSYVNPAAVPEVKNENGEVEEAKVLESIPPELEAFLNDDKNKELKDKLVKAAEEVPQKVAETTADTIAEINESKGEGEEKVSVSFNVEEGLSTVEEFASDVSAPTRAILPTDPPKGKNWAERNWWVILLICIGAVLVIGIVVAILVVSLSSSGSSGSGKANKKEIEKSEKIMDTVVPIEKIKQENEISDDDIYKPFSYEVIMEGYLLKEGHDRVIGKWQRRYCVLYFEPSVLRIYDSMVPSYYGKVYIEEKQSIPLDCYAGIEYKEGSNEFTLVLKVRDSTIKSFEAGDKERKIHLKVEGENGIETAKRWVECFRDFKNQKPKSGDAWTRPLIVDQQNGKISTSTSKAAEKKNEDIVLKAQQRRQAHAAANVN